jgi:uncharacterized protein YbaR (Trm112 family)/ubiquinone/menaquinone biosynthesis C-methylase UbiE
MHTYLIEKLACPVCHCALEWTIVERTEDDIEAGSAQCTACAAVYPVREGIGVFLAPEQRSDRLWEQQSRQVQYVREHPEVERQLLDTPLDALHPADQHWRAMILETRGRYVEAQAAAERAQEGLYTAAARADMRSQFDAVIARLAASDDPIVDLASGRCYLVEALLRALPQPIVATDLSLPVLRRDRRYLAYWGLYDRVSLLAFDARHTPFCEGGVETMTTFVGLPSVREPRDLLAELRRVVSGTLFAISVFYSEADEVHAPVIRQAGMDTLLFRSAALETFAAAGWQVRVENARSAQVRPTSRGILLPEFQVDGFPLAETTQQSCLLIAT